MSRIHTQKTGIPRIKTKAEEVADKLTRRIFSEGMREGTKLPSGHELAAEFGVAITVIREATKRLEALGIVRSWRGSGVYVHKLDFIRSVDMFDALITREDGTLDAAFLLEVAEFVDDFVRLMVRLAAGHRTDADVASLKRLFEDWCSAQDNLERLTELGNAIYRALVQATHNRVCQALFGTVAGPRMKLSLTLESMVLDFGAKKKMLRRIIEAVEEGDPVMAEAAAARHLQDLLKLASSGVPAGQLLDYRSAAGTKVK
jgi:DNA-binding FadR family transcriptional regulator